MKKIIYVVCAVVCAWMVFSFVDIVSDNNSQNPEHANINLFCLMTAEEETAEPQNEIMEVWGEVVEINEEHESIVIVDENDHEWVAFADTAIYEVGDEVMVVFDNMVTDDWYDDEIVDLIKW